MEKEEIDPEFKQWILDKVKKTPVRDMCDDEGFTTRLLIDMLHGRSKSFNKNSRKSNVAGGLNLLEQEYRAEKEG